MYIKSEDKEKLRKLYNSNSQADRLRAKVLGQLDEIFTTNHMLSPVTVEKHEKAETSLPTKEIETEEESKESDYSSCNII